MANKKALKPGTVLNSRYVIKQAIGEGNFGITYEGWDNLLESRIAIKEFFPVSRVTRDVEQGTNEVFVFQDKNFDEILRKYLDEAKRLSQLNQVEGIVSIRDFFYENKTAYIIMEYIEGISLKEYIGENGAMEPENALEMVRPVLDALERVHKIGLIHRDISPDNLIVTKEKKLVLVDFGAARQVDTPEDRSLTVMIKRGYSSPEQYRSHGEQGAWSDVYAICATIYFMLTGKVPDEAIDRILDDEIISLNDMSEVRISRQMGNAIMKGISIRTNERYQNVAELNQALWCEKKDKEEKRKAYLLLPICLIFIGLGCLVWWMYAKPEHQHQSKEQTITPAATKSQEYKMISFIGMTRKNVESCLQVMGPVHVTWKKEYHDKIGKGFVISQSIPKDTMYSANSGISLELVLSKGRKKVNIPNLFGKDITKAKSILKAKKLKTKIIRKGSSKPRNTVIYQNKKAGKDYVEGTTVTLTISDGIRVTATPKPQPIATKKPERKDNYDGIIS